MVKYRAAEWGAMPLPIGAFAHWTVTRHQSHKNTGGTTQLEAASGAYERQRLCARGPKRKVLICDQAMHTQARHWDATSP